MGLARQYMGWTSQGDAALTVSAHLDLRASAQQACTVRMLEVHRSLRKIATKVCNQIQGERAPKLGASACIGGMCDCYPPPHHGGGPASGSGKPGTPAWVHDPEDVHCVHKACEHAPSQFCSCSVPEEAKRQLATHLARQIIMD